MSFCCTEDKIDLGALLQHIANLCRSVHDTVEAVHSTVSAIDAKLQELDEGPEEWHSEG